MSVVSISQSAERGRDMIGDSLTRWGLGGGSGGGGRGIDVARLHSSSAANAKVARRWDRCVIVASGSGSGSASTTTGSGSGSTFTSNINVDVDVDIDIEAGDSFYINNLPTSTSISCFYSVEYLPL